MERVGRLQQLVGIIVLAGLMAFAPSYEAAAAPTPHHHLRHHHASRHASAPAYHAALLVDADSGNVLYAHNATLEWPPASMAKMMLLLVAEEQIKAGRFRLSDPVRISQRAALTRGSHIELREGEVYPLGELMKAALIRSANDAAVAVAEKIGGSLEGCVRMMNEKARALGMTGTYYQTVDGLPPTPGHDVDHTNAMDLATLARAIIHDTDLLQWSGMETAPFDGGVMMLRNTNHLIGHYEGCDGLKTGFTYEAGFNLTATAMRGNMRLVSVILGAPSNPQRFAQSARLLSWGFDNYAKVQVLRRGELLPVHVQVNSGAQIQPVAESDLALVMRKTDRADLKLEYNVPPVVDGPVASGASMGQVIILNRGEVMTKVDAICPLANGDAAKAATAPGAGGAGANLGTTAALAVVPVSTYPVQVNK